MALWHVGTDTITRLLLWRTAEASFRVVQSDILAEVLTNYDYVLFDRKYEAVLRQLAGQVQLTPVTVTDTVRQQHWDHFLELKITRALDTEQVQTAHVPGSEIFVFNRQHVFVSEALKEALQQVPTQTLHFSQGLSEFA